MGGTNYCSVPGCRSRYGPNSKLADKNHRALFSQPKNKEELGMWRKALQSVGKELNICDKVCELHFTEDCILRCYETLLPDGTVWRMKRSRCNLKPGSVPTIFPDSKNVSKEKSGNTIKISPEKRKIPNNTYSCLKKKKILNKNLECPQSTISKDHKHSVMIVNDNISDSTEIGKNKNSNHSVKTIKNVPESTEKVENEISKHPNIAINSNVLRSVQRVKNKNSEHSTKTLNYDDPGNVELIENKNSEVAEVIFNETTKAFTYSMLVNNLKLISRPDWSWGISVHDEFIMCAKWNYDSSLMKRVIIDCNLNIQVFLKHRAIDFNGVKINSIKDLSSILNEVDTYRLCVNVDNRKKTKCDGYIPRKKESIQCEYCRLIGDWEGNKKHSMYWLSKGRNFAKHQILYEKIDILNQKNALLKEQLSKIIKIKAVWKLSNQTNLNPIED